MVRSKDISRSLSIYVVVVWEPDPRARPSCRPGSTISEIAVVGLNQVLSGGGRVLQCRPLAEAAHESMKGCVPRSREVLHWKL